MKDNILITGCGGFIASNIAKNLINSNQYDNIISIDNFLTGSKSSLPEKVICFEGDCSDKLIIKKVF